MKFLSRKIDKRHQIIFTGLGLLSALLVAPTTVNANTDISTHHVSWPIYQEVELKELAETTEEEEEEPDCD